MPAPTIANLLLYAAQAALLTGTLALMLVALRPSPAFRLAACRAVLLVLLLLPFQGLLGAPQPDAQPMAPLAGFGALAFERVDARAEAGVSWSTIAAAILIAGAGMRLLWLVVGLARLARLTRGLPAADDSDEIAAMQAELGTRARVYFAPGVSQPVTFGLTPARVLLPASLLAASVDQQRAVLCHELLHVRRRDWAWVLVEEGALALLWFHPAVWWLVGEQQLAREQVVDQLTVATTGARRAYMDALLSAADAPSAPPLLAGFLRRRHLARRLIALSEEVAMSSVRLAVGGVLMVGVLAASSAVALAAWPLVLVPQTASPEPSAPTAFRVAHRVAMNVPSGLSAELTSAVLTLDTVVAADGAVTSVRVVSAAGRNDEDGRNFFSSDLRSIGSMADGMAAAGRPAWNAAALSSDLNLMLNAAAAALTQWRFERPSAAPAIARVTARFDLPAGPASIVALQPLSGFPGAANITGVVPALDGVLRVGGTIRPPQKLVNVPPVYPQEAKDARVQGVVVLDVTLDARGVPADINVLRSIPMLDQAAIDAVKQWRYQPTHLNGAPVPVRVTVTINFTLSDEAERP